jgi:hypothetical protein
MADFSVWSRESLEKLATDLTARCIQLEKDKAIAESLEDELVEMGRRYAKLKKVHAKLQEDHDVCDKLYKESYRELSRFQSRFGRQMYGMPGG